VFTVATVPDRPLAVRQAGAILRRLWPEAAVTDVVARTGGQLSTVHEVRCAGPPYEVIVKRYAEQWRWKLAKEVHVYAMLGEHGVGPVPAILDTEQGDGLIGTAFIVMTKLPGRPLSEVVTELDLGEVRAVYRQMGTVLAAVHRIGMDAFGYLTTEILDPEPDNAAYMTRQFARKLREFAAHGGDRGLHDAVGAHVAERSRLFARCAAPALCHNDFYEGNILVDRTAEGWIVTGFVDVENAVAADPLLDLAKTDYYSIRGDETKLSGFLDGYGPLPVDGPDRLRLYRLYHALELWDWFASIGDTAPLPGIADDIRALTAR
jgi:hygromycin-B 7''-O-kinase